MSREKCGVIDVGGGMRGIYAAGVLDRCLDDGVAFDVGIGVSAGSANLSSFAAGQKRRNYKYYTEYAFRKAYMSMRNKVFKGSFIDLDYVYGTLSNSHGEYPLDYAALRDNPMELYVVAQEAETGKVKYFTKDDISQDHYDVCKASSAIPLVCKPYVINGVPYFDGALGDAVPVEKAFALGCAKAVLILTLPVSTVRTSQRDEKIARAIRRKYPRSAENLQTRAERYNQSVAQAREYAAQGKVLIVAPDDTCGVNTLVRDLSALHALYEKGYADGAAIAPFLAQNAKK